MLIYEYPLFNQGRILKIEMLNELRDYPRELTDILFGQYSNGIIQGCELKINNNYIVVKKGLIKHDGIIYVLKKDKMIPYENTENTVMLKVRFRGETKNSDFIRYESEIIIDDDLNIQSDEIELCRFKLKKGAKLRAEYISLEDMSTEYDTVNIINSPFAAVERSSLSPYILKQFAKEAFQNNLTDAFDISFCMMCLRNGEVLERELIINYIAARLKVRNKNYSNEEIYQFLLRILGDIRNGRENFKASRIDYKKIIVD